VAGEELFLPLVANYGMAGVLSVILWYKLGRVEQILYQIKGSLDGKD